MYFQSEQMLKKARQRMHGSHPTILAMARQRNVQNFVVTVRVDRKEVMLYDRIAVEKHLYEATRAERIQESKHWILTLNAEGRQQPLN